MTNQELQEYAKWLGGFTVTLGLIGTGLGAVKGPLVGWSALLFLAAGAGLALSLALFSLAYALSMARLNSGETTKMDTAGKSRQKLFWLAAILLSLSIISAAVTPLSFYLWDSRTTVRFQRDPPDTLTLTANKVRGDEVVRQTIWGSEASSGGEAAGPETLLSEARRRPGMDGKVEIVTGLAEWAGMELRVTVEVQQLGKEPFFRKETLISGSPGSPKPHTGG